MHSSTCIRTLRIHAALEIGSTVNVVAKEELADLVLSTNTYDQKRE